MNATSGCTRPDAHNAAGSATTPSTPQGSDAQYAAEYAPLAALGWDRLIDRYRLGVENFDRRIFDLTDEQLDAAFLPSAGVGRWPVRVLLAHLADAEMAYTFRIRKAVAEDGATIEGWDENAWIDSGLYGRPGAPSPSIGGSVAVVHTLRLWGADWLPSLTPAQRLHRVVHPTRGALSVLDMTACTTWHLEHHAGFLNRKVEKMLGAAKPRAGGPCGPSCGCHGR